MVDNNSLYYDIIMLFLTAVIWYFTVYQIVEMETKNCIERIEWLKKVKGKGITVDKKTIDNAIEANKKPLKVFSNPICRTILLWIPYVIIIVLFPIFIIIFILSKYNIVLCYNDAYMWINSAICLLLFTLILLILISGFILISAFWKHPEKEYIKIYLELKDTDE